MNHLQPDQVTLADLPQQLRHITEVVGLAAALTLVKHFGGVRLYVPLGMTQDHTLTRLIGYEAACKLSAEFGGMNHFDIPRAAKALRVVRNREIIEKFISGNSLRTLAFDYVMTERQIQKILTESGVNNETRQAALF
ncbi:hypothetical protein GTP58_28305 [Duganella sp. CY15W]|uniref:Mor transcription activator family protein n=1 Tax=Duganella sp. CY15W TaxID=2692172 RepID=UPI00136F9C80|nr:hypothetical protein [Duganella sp. CY15W]